MIDMGCIHPVKPPTLVVVGEIPPIQIPIIAGWPICKFANLQFANNKYYLHKISIGSFTCGFSS